MPSHDLSTIRKKQQQTITAEQLKYILARLDWIKILNNAIASRPTSWNPEPVREWRNAGDTVYGAVIQALQEADILLTMDEEILDFKDRFKIPQTNALAGKARKTYSK